MDIPVAANVPGVGRGYQNHPVVSYHYKSNLPKDETNDIAFIDPPTSIETMLAAQVNLLGWNGFDVTSSTRRTEEEVEGLGMNFKRTWDRDFKSGLSKPLCTILLSVG
ncbi:hypothetical protein F5Y08DRAFT_318175 [Xylaria arbuscula]|nr:hypothetical protein F5Y08DRAFT_318175 [Xylaria arbuscula]